MKKIILNVFIILNSLLMIQVESWAATIQRMRAGEDTGMLNSDFGLRGKGFFTTSDYGEQSSFNDVVIDKDGFIYAVGTTLAKLNDYSTADMLVAKFNPDGTPDLNFGNGNGFQIFDPAAMNEDGANGVVLSKDENKIHVCGFSRKHGGNQDADISLITLDKNGNLLEADSSDTGLRGDENRGFACGLLFSDNIIVAGNTINRISLETSVAMVIFDKDGKLMDEDELTHRQKNIVASDLAVKGIKTFVGGFLKEPASDGDSLIIKYENELRTHLLYSNDISQKNMIDSVFDIEFSGDNLFSSGSIGDVNTVEIAGYVASYDTNLSITNKSELRNTKYNNSLVSSITSDDSFIYAIINSNSPLKFSSAISIGKLDKTTLRQEISFGRNGIVPEIFSETNQVGAVVANKLKFDSNKNLVFVGEASQQAIIANVIVGDSSPRAVNAKPEESEEIIYEEFGNEDPNTNPEPELETDLSDNGSPQEEDGFGISGSSCSVNSKAGINFSGMFFILLALVVTFRLKKKSFKI